MILDILGMRLGDVLRVRMSRGLFCYIIYVYSMVVGYGSVYEEQSKLIFDCNE